jgi:hypothetical protein
MCAFRRRQRNLPRAASVDFLFVRRECSLAGTTFSSGFLFVHPELLECFPAPQYGASGGIFLARNLYAEALFNGSVSVSGCACSQRPACRAAVTSVPKEFLFSGVRRTSLKLDTRRNVPGSYDSCPKGAFSSSHVEVNAIETWGSTLFFIEITRLIPENGISAAIGRV